MHYIFLLEYTSMTLTLILLHSLPLHLPYNNSAAICGNLSAYPAIQTDVQLRVNHLNMWGDLLHSVPVFIISFFAGTIADRVGMKICILLPMLGKK